MLETIWLQAFARAPKLVNSDNCTLRLVSRKEEKRFLVCVEKEKPLQLFGTAFLFELASF
jgi:hypothetical protein